MSKHTPIEERSVHGGTQEVFRFANGYGASVIRHQFSYGSDQGLWELAVLKFEGEGYDLCYDTPITEDVEGGLTRDEVDVLLDEISALVPESA